MKAATLLAAAWLGVALCDPAGAQSVWRCGEAGNVYSDRPCADGRPLAAADARPAAALAQARAVHQRELQGLQRLAAERREREAAAPAAAGFGAGGRDDAVPVRTKKLAKPPAHPPRTATTAAAAGTSRAAARASRRTPG